MAECSKDVLLSQYDISLVQQVLDALLCHKIFHLRLRRRALEFLGFL